MNQASFRLAVTGTHTHTLTNWHKLTNTTLTSSFSWSRFAAFKAHCCYSTRNPSHLSDNFLLIYVQIPDTEQCCRRVNSCSETQYAVFVSPSLFCCFSTQLASAAVAESIKQTLPLRATVDLDAAPGRALNLLAKIADRCAPL